MKTLEKLINDFEGCRIYVYLSDQKTGDQFLKNAEKEGFLFGDGTAPTKRKCSNIMAVNHDKTINYVNFVGHYAFGSHVKYLGEQKLIRINYDAYINGLDYIM